MAAIKIKAGSITNLTDARYFSAWEVEWLGFNLSAGEDNSIDPLQVAAIREWVEGPKIVGEFNLGNKQNILELIKTLQLDAVQVGMFTDLTTVMDVSNECPVIKEIVVEAGTTPGEIAYLLEHFAPYSSGFLLNFDKGGFTWSDVESAQILSPAIVQSFCAAYPILLGIGVSAEELPTLLDQLQPLGLNLLGGEEEKTGVKSFEAVDAIFEVLAQG